MVFRCFLQESIFRPNGRLSHIACHKYASAVNCSYQETTLVHPTRRQSFAGKMDSTFYNIWDLVIYIIPTSREHRNIAQLCTISIHVIESKFTLFHNFVGLYVIELWNNFTPQTSPWINQQLSSSFLNHEHALNSGITVGFMEWMMNSLVYLHRRSRTRSFLK